MLQQSHCGFSFIELLVILTIIAITAALALPSLTHLWQATTAKTLKIELEHAIHTAQTNAYNTGMPTQLCPSTDTKSCAKNWSQGFIVTANQRVLYVFQNLSASGELHWRSFPKNLTSLHFLPQARLTEQNGTFWYCAAAEKNPLWAITLNKIARVREILPDRSGRIVDEKNHVLTC